MKRIGLIAGMVGVALVAWWRPWDSPSAKLQSQDIVQVAARPGQPRGSPPSIAEERAALLDEPGDEEPGLPSVPPRQSTAVPPLPRTIKLAAGAEPPLLPADRGAGAATFEPVDDGAGEPPADLGPVTVLENHRAAFRQYALKFGGNPVGDNAEITAALRGQNPRRSVFLTANDGLRVNGEGQAVDAWGTPYFFHQLSRTEMEIRSAGPDHRMWTTDDLVLK